MPHAAGGFVADANDIPDAIGAGDSREEAELGLVLGIAAICEHADAEGFEVPKPRHGYNGSLSIRLPRSLHQALA